MSLERMLENFGNDIINSTKNILSGQAFKQLPKMSSKQQINTALKVAAVVSVGVLAIAFIANPFIGILIAGVVAIGAILIIGHDTYKANNTIEGKLTTLVDNVKEHGNSMIKDLKKFFDPKGK